MELKYIVDIDNIKVKDFLKLKGCSRNLLKKIRVSNQIFVNGEIVKNYYTLRLKDELVIRFDERLNDKFEANDMDLDVLYEDEYLLIINKPQGLSSQPSRKHPKDNLISVVKNYYLQQGITSNIHLVTRLDFSTTGIVIIAKIGFIHFELSKRDIIKKYLCYVEGKLSLKTGSINLPIKQISDYDIRRCICDGGQRAITEYQVITEGNDKSLVEAKLVTGRTHQIRLHFSHLGHPLIGDNLYGNGKYNDTLMLHCYLVEFIHPVFNEVIKIFNYPDWYKED